MGQVKKIFKLNLLIMRLLGFYPPQRFKEIYKFYAYAVYVCLTVPVPILAAIYLLVSENVDLAEIGDSSFIIFQAGCYIFKLIPFVFNSDGIRKSIYLLELPIFNNYSKKQEIIYENCVKICKRNTWLFLGFCAFTFILWIMMPLLGNISGGNRTFPIEIWLPFDASSSSKRHALKYLFVCLGVGNGAISNGVIDPLISGMACFAAYQLKILKDNLENLSENTEKEFSINYRPEQYFINKVIYRRIAACVDHHNAILDFIQNYENIYSSVAFTQFAASVLVICVSCLQLSMIEPFTFTFMVMISFLLTMLLEIFLYCYFGTSLYDESNSLTSAIYMGKWYKYDVQSKQALLVLMERSKKPIVVTAGKILDLSLATFTTILRRAYSLLAVLKNYEVEI